MMEPSLPRFMLPSFSLPDFTPPNLHMPDLSVKRCSLPDSLLVVSVLPNSSLRHSPLPHLMLTNLLLRDSSSLDPRCETPHRQAQRPRTYRNSLHGYSPLRSSLPDPLCTAQCDPARDSHRRKTVHKNAGLARPTELGHRNGEA